MGDLNKKVELPRGLQDAKGFLSKKISLDDKKSFGKAEEEKESQPGIFQRLKDNLMGTPEQNEKAKKEMAEQDAKNPNTTQAKVNRMLKPEEKKKGGKISSYKAGGSVKSASARADGCAIRGKTRA